MLERVALSCHSALDLLCDKAEFHDRPMLRVATAAPLPFWSTRFEAVLCDWDQSGSILLRTSDALPPTDCVHVRILLLPLQMGP